MSRAELAEWILMIAVIVSWWPLIFLGWSPAVYRITLYVGSSVILGIILVRRMLRLHEAFSYSRRIIQQQHALRFGRQPPLTIESQMHGQDGKASGAAQTGRSGNNGENGNGRSR
ncbi:MAG: hypothetical protein H5T86_12415 [Armatimonadetes bacterium]|nr:hypothetical protein [Armatimonadota bacterium]